MAAYKVFFKTSVWKDLKAVPDKDLTKIMACIESLGNDPRRSGSKKLSKQEKYRFRYGSYRIIYSIQDEDLTVWVVKVGHRRDVYR